MKNLLWILPVAALFSGCAKKREVFEIDPNATRHVLQVIRFGDPVEFRLREKGFDASAHCLQWIEYRLNSKVIAQRVELSNEVCPADGTALKVESRVAQWKFSATATVNYYVLTQDGKNIGVFSQDTIYSTGYNLESLCAFSEQNPSPFKDKCEIQLENNKIKQIVVK